MQISNSLSLGICLWFDDNALEAAQFYTQIFPDSKIKHISYYGSEGVEFHGKPVGSVMTVEFNIGEMQITALNGGSQFQLSEAASLVLICDTQAEIDRYWDLLSSDGGTPMQCGWLKDRFGLSWQVNPRSLQTLLQDEDQAKVQRTMQVLFTMQKLDIKQLEAAAGTSN